MSLQQLESCHSICQSPAKTTGWVKRVLRYLQGTLNYGLKFSVHGEQTELNGYSDADWAGDVDTRRSTSGYVFQFGNGTIS